ncbi:MAG: translation initiation factor IF-3 [Actinomycetales bacterium]
MNDRIRVPEVRLVGPNGEQVGIVRVEDALRLAAEADLDLVEVAPNARPPVCKLMDFGKFKYESAMKAREARRNQTNTVIKEIKLRPKIDPHDYGTKKGHVERFLRAGDKVKVTIMFRGREQSRPELGFRLLQRLAEDIGELGFVESTPKQDGRNMIMVIGPTRKKAEAKAEERRRREQTSREPVPSQAAASEPVIEPVMEPVIEPTVEQAAEPMLEPAPEAAAVAEPEATPEVTPQATTEATPEVAPEIAATAPEAAPEPAAVPRSAPKPAPRPAAPAAKAPAKKAAAKTASKPATKTASKATTKTSPATSRTSKTAEKPAAKSAAKTTGASTAKVAEPAADAS